jgi:uncharacterized membrane protein
MDRILRIGRAFFAIALIGLGVEHFIFRDFVTGRAPVWPASIPGGLMWAYLSGIVLIVAGGAILFQKAARAAAIVAAVLIGSWALLRHIPVILGEAFLSGAWTRAGKAMTLAAGALAIAATVPPLKAAGSARLLKLANRDHEFIVLGQVCLGLFLLLTGIQHFMFTEFVASLIPDWFPGNAVFWTYFAGVALLAGGIGLFITRTTHVAALLSGVMVFSWFWIVHIPRTFVGVSDGIAVFEALAVSGIALVLAAYQGAPRLSEGRPERSSERAV